MTREELKMMFLQMDCSNTPVKKEIIVDLRYIKNKWWPGYGYVQILSEGSNGYSSFSSHEEYPMKYAENRIKEEKYKEYKLIIKK